MKVVIQLTFMKSSPCSVPRAWHILILISETGAVTPMLPLRKLKHREMKEPTYSHPAGRGGLPRAWHSPLHSGTDA